MVPQFIVDIYQSPMTFYILWLTTIVIFSIMVLSGKLRSLSVGKWIQLEGGRDSNHEVKTRIPLPLNAARDVKQYNLILEVIFFGQNSVISDIRYRVRKNGWLKRTDWDQYVEDAIKAHRHKFTQFLDIWYPTECKVDRIELYEWNQGVFEQIVARYRRLYMEMFHIFKTANAEAELIREELHRPILCQGTPMKGATCVGSVSALDKISQLHKLEGIETRELCMNEAERALTEIAQIYFSHYMTIYKNTPELGEGSENS